MTVYVESNFVLERALLQEQHASCETLQTLAQQGRIILVVPAFSLVEPFDSLTRKAAARLQLSGQLRSHVNELGRSEPYRDVPLEFERLGSVLTQSGKQERIRLRHTIKTLLRESATVPLDQTILDLAMDGLPDCKLSDPDSIVLASVLTHLQAHRPPESCFLNRNSKDFDQAAVRARLAALGCKLFGRFDEGLNYIQQRLAPIPA